MSVPLTCASSTIGTPNMIHQPAACLKGLEALSHVFGTQRVLNKCSWTDKDKKCLGIKAVFGIQFWNKQEAQSGPLQTRDRNSLPLHDFPKVKPKTVRDPLGPAFLPRKCGLFPWAPRCLGQEWDQQKIRGRDSPPGQTTGVPSGRRARSPQQRTLSRRSCERRRPNSRARIGLSGAGRGGAARNTARRSKSAPGGRRPQSPHPGAGPGWKPRQQSCSEARKVRWCGQLPGGGSRRAPWLPSLPFLPRPCAELRPCALRSFPAEHAGPGWPAPKPRAPGWRAPRRPPGRRRPPRAGTHSDRSPFRCGAAARAGAGHGRAPRGAGGGRGRRRPARWGRGARASREQAARPPACRTADRPGGRCGPKFAKTGFPKWTLITVRK
ncbi:translation initiation factor IF-2-like [Acinonyx jubatus]|uniref:Translation initiation factor IF-2-like n=1 Tax=Acinonyx jubatus TaxID=32536 RepID=A0ABM3Q5Y1_ACIJB|nr:translation initiation factor IF-2-like [Acinonyx jubatus]